jgi:hypothetical protein
MKAQRRGLSDGSETVRATGKCFSPLFLLYYHLHMNLVFLYFIVSSCIMYELNFNGSFITVMSEVGEQGYLTNRHYVVTFTFASVLALRLIYHLPALPGLIQHPL